ncbi:hypothetical protein [uncultured Nostoc sp.]|uniref:hypothetical protein n=1 Tax=uncultured Nostoc sp. TaxID=340711 RepID=UPI0035CA4F95
MIKLRHKKTFHPVPINPYPQRGPHLPQSLAISFAVKHKSIAIAASQSQTLTIHSTLLRSQSHITSNSPLVIKRIRFSNEPHYTGTSKTRRTR